MFRNTLIRTVSRSSRLLVVVALAAALSPSPAHAYLDPVSGSIILQVLAAGALAGILTVKRFWASIKAMGSRLLGQRDDS